MLKFTEYLKEEHSQINENEIFDFYTNYYSTLTNEELDSLTYYMGVDDNLNSMGHLNINKFLRNWETYHLPFKTADKVISKELDLKIPLSTRIKTIKSIIKKSPLFQKQIIVYRGINKKIFDEIKNRGSKYEPGFISASGKEKIAKKFSEGGYMLRIKLNKNNRYLFLPSLFDKKYLNGSEFEFLISNDLYYSYIDNVDSKTINVELKTKI